MDSAQEEKAYASTAAALRSPIGSIGSSLKQNVAREKAAIDHELSNLHGAVSQAHDLLSHLEARLQPVSAQVPQGEAGIQDRERLGSSNVYNSIHEAVSLVQAVQNRVANLLQLLEV